jgi:hypothetical protein
MQSWYGLWMNHSTKHPELSREAERERLFNRLRAALEAAAGSKPATPLRARGAVAEKRDGVPIAIAENAGWGSEGRQTHDRRGHAKLVPDRLRPAER